MSKNVKRLYEQFQPAHYILDIIPDREQKLFSGSVIITGQKTGRPSQRLSLHQQNLKITSAHITKHDKTGDHAIKVDRLNHHKSFDEIRLHCKEMLYPGKYTIKLEFNGEITRPMSGIYPCFFEHDGKQKELISTQFESHHAREVFPCIDEPEAKATFQLSLAHPTNEVVLSNTPIEKQEKVDNKKLQTKNSKLKTTFEVTPKMSTYLLAFVYGELTNLEAKTKNGIKVRTYATPENTKFTEFALDVAVKTLDFYSNYFGIDYPLEKCDLIALPDFAAGAMENWGCITFREHALLVDPVNSTLTTKQYVAMVVAHELAHQWFGNLVTMRWWTDLWLNEGFASWIEYLAVDNLFPDWQMWTQFAVDEQQQALKLDALENTHAIEVPIHHPDEIRTIFDAISYSKGSSVIHMLHEYLGPDAFRDGLHHYLKRHAYSNTDTVDLWQSLEEISGRPVKDFMHAWTSQPGFPLVKANVADRLTQLEQERFYLNPKAKHHKTQSWPVALLAEDKVVPELMKEAQCELKSINDLEFKLNRGQSGFYRTIYNSSHQKRLGELIHKGHLPPLDRLGILSDLFEAAKAGKADTLDALKFLENFRDEDNYAVWDVIAVSVASLRHVMDNEDLRDNMKPYIRELVAPQLKRLGWDRKPNESHFDRLLRPTILGLAASADEPTIIKRCLELFATVEDASDVKPDLRVTASRGQIKRGSEIDPDLRGTVFGTVARLGGEKEFKKLLKMHHDSTLSEKRTTLAAAITGFEQPEIIDKALGCIISDDVRLQDVAYWIAYSFLNRHAKHSAWQWLKDNWQWLDENLGNDLSFYRMPIYAARAFSDISFLGEYEKFFKPKLSPGLERSYKQGIETLEWHSAWKIRDFKEIMHFFKTERDQ